MPVAMAQRLWKHFLNKAMQQQRTTARLEAAAGQRTVRLQAAAGRLSLGEDSSTRGQEDYITAARKQAS
jgi:hypothetical protein